MTAAAETDSERLWRRVGLQQLRESLLQVECLFRELEGTLKALPPCDACARAALFSQIEVSARRLGGAVTSLSMLADMLRQAGAVAEEGLQTLERCAADACACPAGRCSCGHAR